MQFAIEQEPAAETAGNRRAARFEAPTDGQKPVKVASRGGAKLGLATTQGSVAGIKMYAATHAAKEGALGHQQHMPSATAPVRTAHNVFLLLFAQKITAT